MPCSNRTSAIISIRDVPACFPTEYSYNMMTCVLLTVLLEYIRSCQQTSYILLTVLLEYIRYPQ